MRPTALALSLCALVVLAVSLPRDAFSQGRPGRDQVCVYEHADYGGWEQCYGVGDVVRDLGNLRNQISSVRIFGRAEITLFQHPDFQGRQLVIDSSATNLPRGWNDETDSLRVDVASFGNRQRPGERRQDRVCVYQHVGFGGSSRCFDSGDEVDDLRQIGWNDAISSIRVFGTRVALFEDAGFQGQRLIVDQDIPDLTQISAGGRNTWNDRVSSLHVGDDRFRGRR